MQIVPTEASHQGALAGFEAICPLCGMTLQDTVESNVRADAAQHQAWHDRKGS